MSPATPKRARSDARNGHVGDHAEGRGGVWQIAVPQAARALSTLSHVDYEDAFTVDIDCPKDRTAEQWARAIFDDMSTSQRLQFWSAWMMLGLRLAPPTSPRHILGWEIREKTADHILLGARSRIGMPAELLVKRSDDSVLFDTFVQKSNPIARAVWARTEPTHERVVPSVLRHFRRRINSSGSTARPG